MAKEVREVHKQVLSLLTSLERASLGQYKDLFWKRFLEAYEQGYCTPLCYRRFMPSKPGDEEIRIEYIHARPRISGDTIWRYAVDEGWVTPESGCTPEHEKRYEDIRTLMTWWDAWTFALKSIWYKIHCYETVERDRPTSDEL